MIRPTRRALVLVAAGFPAALLPTLAHRLWPVWCVVAVTVLVMIFLDGLLAAAPRRLALEVRLPEMLAVGERGQLTLELSSSRDLRLEIMAELHPDLAPVPAVWATVAAGVPKEVPLPLAARRRGQPTVDEVWCRWQGPLGLMWRQARFAVGRPVSVAPDLGPVRNALLRAHDSAAIQTGVQVERFIGDGSEFDTLREYTAGLDHRAIDWKASARHRKLLCQEFRAERNHQVVLAFDTGHLMAEQLVGVPRLDHAISAGLLLGYVSLRLGDRVGLFAFDRSARAWTEPHGGLGAFPRLRAATSRLAYGHEETNFTLGLADLSSRLRRRSLVVIFTEFVDSITAELMFENIGRLARRQLVVFVALRDPGLERVALGTPRRLADLYRSTVASDLLRERERVLARLRRLGVRCVDAAPGQISAQLLNRYLDIKRRELV